MLQNLKSEAPVYVHNDQELTVEYSFSEFIPPNTWLTNSKLWLDILFIHPQNDEPVTIRVSKSTVILCQPKEVIEAIVHREIRHFLHQSQVKEYGTAYSHAQVVTAYA